MLLRPAVALAVVTVLALGSGCSGDDARRATDPVASDSAAPSPAPTTTAPPANDLPPVDGPFAAGRTPLPGFAEVAIRIVEGPDGEPVVLCVLLAETPEQRARGLMEVTDPDLGGYDGMVFTYEADTDGGFWMRHTRLPLSIAFLDAGGQVAGTADMDPCPDDAATCPSHAPGRPYRAALEVPQGDLVALGLEEGGPARVEVGGSCAPA